MELRAFRRHLFAGCALLLAVAVACDSSTNDAATPELTVVPTASPTPRAETPPAPTPVATPAVDVEPQVPGAGARPRVAIIDVVQAEGRLLDTPARLTGGYEFYPRFTPDGAGVWLTGWADGEPAAVRYRLDGAVSDKLTETVAVVESPVDSTRAHWAWEKVELERRGDVQEFEPRWTHAVFSPDGSRLAITVYHFEPDHYEGSLSVLDLNTLEHREYWSDLMPCMCDTTPEPQWSPDGRFLAFDDYGFANEEHIPTNPAGLYVLDTVTGDVRHVAEHLRNAWPSPWLPDGSLLVREEGAIAIVDPATGLPTRMFEAPGRAGGAEVDSTGHVVLAREDPNEPPWEYVWHAYRIDTGDLLGTWEEPPTIAWTPDGLVAHGQPVPDQARDGACVPYGETWHPAFEDGVRCLEGPVLGISPDGRYVVVRDGRNVRIVDTIADEERTFDLGAIGSVQIARWNDEGTHLLLAWNFSL